MRVVLALAVMGVLAGVPTLACAPPSLDGSALDGSQPLPARGDDDDDNNATPAPTTTTPPPTVVAPPVDAGTTGTPSVACAIANTALCFTFEGTTSNLSADGLQPTVSSGITYVTGHENEAASFSATSQLEFAASNVFELPAGAATIEAWINLQETGADAVVFDDDGRFSLTIQSTGAMICESSGGAVRGVTVISTGTWNHVACVVDGTNLLAYLNGTLESEGPGSIASAPTLTASVGANAPPGSADGDQTFVGLIDSLRVLNVARGPNDLATDATSP